MTDFVEAEGNLLKAEVDALVNTVNTVGVMGKGIALQFKRAFPENFKDYERACKAGDVALGAMFVHDRGSFTPPRWIVKLPNQGPLAGQVTTGGHRRWTSRPSRHDRRARSSIHRHTAIGLR